MESVNKKILVLSKDRFDNAMKNNGLTDDNIESKDCCIISINDTDSQEGIRWPYFKDHTNVKVLFLDDVDEDLKVSIAGTDKFQVAKAMTEEQGRQIIEHVKANEHKSLFIVHCQAGISRSGAVGEFISDYFGIGYDEFKRNNPWCHPNNHIRILLKVLIREQPIKS